ncbi:MAG: M48 family metallopeptidase [Chloroflexota bacterium]|nr:M48 family metallopeptidase [Chloroflexota bacterium]
MTISIEMSEGRQRKAKEYANLRRVLFFVNMAIGLSGLLVMLFTTLSLRLREALESWNANQWVIVPLYMLLFGGAYALLTFPLSIYSSYYLPRKYGLSHQNFVNWLLDLVKGLVIAGLLGFPLVELLYFGLRWLPEWWWLVGGIFYLFFAVVMVNLAPVLIMPLFNKFIPLENEELKARLLRLAERTGARVKGIYTMDFSRRTSAANAFVAGIGNTRRIVLGDTLTQNYTPDEIEVIMAHELGHHVHADIWRGIGLDAAVTLVGLFITNLILQATLPTFSFRNVGDVASFPLLILALSAFSVITMPLSNGFSRNRENAADRYALETTGNAPAFVSSMKKLANQNLADLNPPGWAVWFFYTHPPIAQRIERGEAFAHQKGINLYPMAGSPATEESA